MANESDLTARLTEMRDWLRQRESELEAQADNMRGDPESVYGESAQMMEFADALSAAITALGEREWQPIETAPKDGTCVLLLSRAHIEPSRWPDDDECHHPARCAIGAWDSNGASWVDEFGQQNAESVAHHLETTGVWNSGGGWFQPNEVTDWQALPAAPSPGKGKGDE